MSQQERVTEILETAVTGSPASWVRLSGTPRSYAEVLILGPQGVTLLQPLLDASVVLVPRVWFVALFPVLASGSGSFSPLGLY